MFIYPYKMGSKSVGVIKSGLDARIIRLENSKFKGSPNKVVVNWGNSHMNKELENCLVLNKPEIVAEITNKLKFFHLMPDSVRVPEFTTDPEVAKGWITEGSKVVCRSVLSGHSGEGIDVVDKEELIDVLSSSTKVYVKYIPKKEEYRVHVMGGVPILVQRKAKKHDIPSDLVNWQVRNHHNGFVFVKNDVNEPEDVTKQALAAMEASGLDFGAVDVIYNEYRKQAFVLEINTAPGLEGTTGDTYIDNFKNYINFLCNDQPSTKEKKKGKAFRPIKGGYNTIIDEAISEAVYDQSPISSGWSTFNNG